MTNEIKIKIKKLREDSFLPTQGTVGSSGYDITLPNNFMDTAEQTCIKQGYSVYKIRLGFALAIPEGYEGQLRMRSSWAQKGVTIPNAPATIDSDYRGELCVLLQVPFGVHLVGGTRVVQLIIQKVEKINLDIVQELDDTSRGTGGFGSTTK